MGARVYGLEHAFQGDISCVIEVGTEFALNAIQMFGGQCGL